MAAGLDRARTTILIVELIVFLGFLGFVLYGTLSAQQGLCVNQNGHPVRRVDIPSSVYVFTCLIAFILGHVLAQIDSVLVRHASAREAATDIDSRPLAAALIHLAIATAFGVLMLMMFTEAFTLRFGFWPITYYARCSIQASPSIALLAAAGLCFLGGRWFWVVEWRR